MNFLKYTRFCLYRHRLHRLFGNNVNFLTQFLVPKPISYNRLFQFYRHFTFTGNFSWDKRGRCNQNRVYVFYLDDITKRLGNISWMTYQIKQNTSEASPNNKKKQRVIVVLYSVRHPSEFRVDQLPLPSFLLSILRVQAELRYYHFLFYFLQQLRRKLLCCL